MRQHPIAVNKTAVESIKLPPRLVEVYSLLASLARQRRAAALNEPAVPPQPAN